MKKQSPLFIPTLLFALAVSQAVQAAPAKSAKSPKSSTKSTTQAGPRKTVGELLKQADRGAGVNFQKKQQIQLPTFSQSLFEKSQSSAPQINLNEVKPPRSSSFFSDPNDDKAKLEMITDQQIQELYKLTQKYKSSPNRGELWLRLAELYVEKASFIDFRKQTEYDQKLKDFQDGKTKVKPVLDLRDAHEYNKRAIQLYEWFVRDFPRDPKIDQALFFLGYNHYELGDTKRGTVYYTRLTKEFPRSPYLVESNFALAEYYFENEKWRTALEHYQVVGKNPRHRLYTFSQYKTAWCYFRSGDSKKALETMESLIRQSREGALGNEKKQASKVRLESEGLRDIVLFYSEVGEPKRAPNYFQSLIGSEAANGYLEKLAYFYADRGNREGARFLFNYLISQNPTSPKAFDYKYQIVKVYSNANKTREFRDELYSWVRDFGTGSAWYQANKSKTDLISNSDRLREQTLRTWVLQQHQTAQNSRAPFSQSLAFEGYKLYLAEFPQSPVIADMHFYFGELLYDMNRYDDAGTQYRWVVENGAGTKFYGKASENTVLALEKNIPKDEEIANRVGKSVDPVPLEPKVDRFVQAGLWYTNKFPQGEKTPEIRFRIGRLYYQHNQFDQAIPYFKDIIQKYPKSKYSEYSANLLLDIFNLKKDYAGLEKAGQELMQIPSIANSEAGKDIKAVLERANFKKAQDLELAKDYAKSAETFEAFARQNPQSDLALSATFNAAINYERAGMNSKALAAHGAVLKSTDKKAESLRVKSRRIVAKLYQDAGQLDEAAKAYQAAAEEAGQDPLAPNLYYNAAVLHEALGQNNNAIRNYDLYYQKAKKSERIDALYSIATLHRKANRLSGAVDKYKDFVNMGGGAPEKNVESAYWIYRMSETLRRPRDVEEWKRKTLSLQAKYAPNKKGVGAKYAAQIKLEDAHATFKEFRALPLNNVKKLKEQSDKKISLLTKLNSQLAEVIKYDSPEEIVGALTLLGQANLHMGEAFIAAPLPPELKAAEEINQYKAGVQKIADPFFAKAKDSLKTAVDRGLEFEAYSDEYRKARELVGKLDGKLFYDNGEEAAQVRQPNWMGL
jgi:TolA-binding protein